MVKTAKPGCYVLLWENDITTKTRLLCFIMGKLYNDKNHVVGAWGYIGLKYR
jgi:hypothetical protein